MSLSIKAKQNLKWLEKCQGNYSVLLSQFIDVVKPMLYNLTNTSMEVSVGMNDPNKGFRTFLTSKTNNVLLRLEVVDEDIKLFFSNADNLMFNSVMFAVNLSCIENFNMEKIEFPSQGYIIYTADFTYMNIKYHLKFKMIK